MAGAVMCRMSQYFDNPDSFDPSRFDPENKRYIHQPQLSSTHAVHVCVDRTVAT